MGLVACLVEDIQTVLVGELEIAVHRRIVRSTHSVEIELLEYLHILADGGLVHLVSRLGMLHVRVDGFDLDGLAVQQEHSVLDLGLLETYLLRHLVYDLSGTVRQRKRKVVKVRSLGSPFQRGLNQAHKPRRTFAARGQSPGAGFHPGYGTASAGHLGTYRIGIQTGIVSPHIHIDRQIGISKGVIEIRDDIPVIDPGLAGGVHPHVVKYARQAPIVLPFKIITV